MVFITTPREYARRDTFREGPELLALGDHERLETPPLTEPFGEVERSAKGAGESNVNVHAKNGVQRGREYERRYTFREGPQLFTIPDIEDAQLPEHCVSGDGSAK